MRVWGFINSLLLLHNKAQCIFQGFVRFNLLPILFHFRAAETSRGWGRRSPRSQSAGLSGSVVHGEPGCVYAACWQRVRDGAGRHFSSSNVQSCLRSIHLPGVSAAGPEVGVHVAPAELCRSGGGKVF